MMKNLLHLWLRVDILSRRAMRSRSCVKISEVSSYPRPIKFSGINQQTLTLKFTFKTIIEPLGANRERFTEACLNSFLVLD